MDFDEKAAQVVLNMVVNQVGQEGSANLRLKNVWWLLLAMQAKTLTNVVRHYTGERVSGGPFKGTALTHDALKLYNTPVLLGCYEHELHPTVEDIVRRGYDTILNIGCSVGYYAVGLARRMPHAQIYAFDTDPGAQQKCSDLVRLNQVQERVHVGGLFNGDAFAAHQNKGKVLVLMDIEGGETDLLDPARYPALQAMDVLVELHDCLTPGLSAMIQARFTATHATQIITNRNQLPDVTGILPPHEYIDTMHEALLGWEGREGPTPWGYFTRKAS